jgi:SNF2 family DNA or RNA helicase
MPHELVEPDGLDATLRPYQRRGLAWMNEMVDLGLGGVLADDMGLGKTIQLIALHLHRMQRMSATAGGDQHPTLVVCPATLVGNWQHELRRFAPGLAVHRYHGADRDLADIGATDVVITTYGIARRDQPVLADQPWGLVVADEAQQIKNPNASVSKAMRQLPAGARLALTGTPVENRLTELWSLLDWTTPGLLGGVEAFRRNVAIPIERDRDPDVTSRFARIVSPFLLRRRKDDPEVAPDLPPKTETDHPVVLTEEQAGLYRAVVEEILDEIDKAEGIARRGLVLKLLTALKQVCNHPAHYLGQPGPLAGRSGKLDAFDDLVRAIGDAGDSTLVFTQYVAMGDLLMARLAELGLPAEFLHGSLALGRRTEMVERFQSGDFGVFVISLKAGGVGLNLTKATHVVHYDRWWNPAVENQASDRAWRIGQDRPVQVHRLISEGTLEERIATVLADKAALAEAVVGTGEAWLTELDHDELAELVTLGRDED